MPKNDIQLKKDIEAELEWDPKVNAARIGVSVESSIVSLFGEVDTYAEKWAAEAVTKRVGGVRVVAQELTVKTREEHARTDAEIARAAEAALAWNVYVPNTVCLDVERGVVTLTGAVTSNYQREAAAQAVRYLTGITAVHNCISLRSEASSAKVKQQIQAALTRQALDDSNSIEINTSDGKVTLTGHASSWQSIEDAAHAAWAAPGVTEVIDQIALSGTSH